MPAVPDATALDAGPAFERALAALEGELAVVFTNADRVAAACADLRRAAGGWTDAVRLERLLRLFPLVHRRTGPFLQPVLALLREASLAAASPWTLIAGLLESRDEDVCARTLEDAASLSAAGALRLTDDHLQVLADLGEREGSPLFGPVCLSRLAGLVRKWRPSGPRAGSVAARAQAARDPLLVLLLDPTRPAVRRLAARLLDLPGRLPDPGLVRDMLSGPAATILAPVLTYTRAGHHDLVNLVVRPGEPAPVAASLPAVIDRCGQALANDIVGELGWGRVNLGLTARRWLGVSVDESLPFLLAPAEARLVGACPGARLVFEHVLATGHGGTLEPPGAAGAHDSVVARFRAYNLAHADVLADILDVAPITAARVETILGKMDRITAEFASLFASRSEECALVSGVYAGLKQRIREEMARAPAGRVLSVELTRLVQMFEDPPALGDVQTLHGLKRYLHQRGLALGFGLLETSQSTNRTVDLALVSSGRVQRVVRAIEYVDFDPDRVTPGEPPPVPYPVAVVADAFGRHLLNGQASLPRVRIFCYGNEVHYFVSFRNHPVFVRIDYSPPLGGGMIDLAYYGVSKYELEAHPGIGLEAIQAIFRRLDFQVEVDNTRIHARYDKERTLDLADLCEKAEALFRLAPYLMDVDWIIGDLDLSADARRAVGAAWADFFARWGVLPSPHVVARDGRSILLAREPRPEGVQDVYWPGDGAYEDVLSGRPRRGWLAEVHAALVGQGLELPFVEQEREAGQIPLEKYVLRPLRAALGRGALVEARDGFQPASPEQYLQQHEADRFAMLLASTDQELARAARLAPLAAALERSLRFKTTGSVNGHEVQRADLVFRDMSGALYALRDGGGILRLAIFAPGSALCLHRDDPGTPWRDSASWDVEALAAQLRRNNFLPSWIDVPPSRADGEARTARAVFATANPRGTTRMLPGGRVVPGLKASPGRAVGLARLGTRGRQPADLAGGVLFATTLRPEDSVFLPHAAAVVGTGGGILSHAGLMAVQFGRPALVVPGSWREEPDGSASLVYRRVEFEEQERVVCGCVVVERRDVREQEERLREGDLVVVDADGGALEVLGQRQPALALHDGLRGLEEASRRLSAATSPEDVLAQRGHRLRAQHQLERLLARLTEPALVQHAVRELLTGVPAGAVDTGRREQVGLLQVLSGNPESGALAGECAERVAREVLDRYLTAHAEALRLIPTAQHAQEVLALRSSVARLHETLEQVSAFLETVRLDRPAGGEPAPGRCRAPAPADVGTLAVDRLLVLYRRVLAGLRARAPGGGRAADRHLLRQAQRLADVLGLGDADREALAQRERALTVRDEATVRTLAGRVVLWPEDGGLELEPLAGSKAANLAELQRLGAAGLVPPWFVVTDRAFREALAAPAPPRPGGPWTTEPGPRSLGEAIEIVVARDDAEPAQKAALIAQLWADVRLPPALVAGVIGAYARLAGPEAARPPESRDVRTALGSRILGTDRRAPPPVSMDGERMPSDLAGAPYVAIRSSAREEDTEAAVRAGEFDTFLFVRGAEAVLQHLRRAWSGLWTARAIHARAAGGRAGRGRGGGVIVQCIAWSSVSGVLQTTNVAEGRTREMVINVGLGLGEGVVSGLVAADHVVVSKDEDPETEPLRFRYVTADKRERVIFDARRGTGTVRADVLSHERLRAALEYAELVELVRVAARLESAYGYPLDIEFGFEGAALRILQVRPVPGASAARRRGAARVRVPAADVHPAVSGG